MRIYLPKKNGVSYYGTGIYKCWGAIKQRCNNANNPRYHKYGGRGIKSCKRWDNFKNFLEDMGDRPKNKNLGRIDTKGNYCKENCKWITNKELALSRERTILIKYKGKKYCLQDLSKKIGVCSRSIKKRYAKGIDLTKRLPTIPNPKIIDLKGFVFKDKRDIDIIRLRKFGCTLQQIGDIYNLTRERIRQIIKKNE